MKRITKRFAFLSMALSCLILLSFNANAQLLNEVEVDPPVDVGDRCQYVEILGTPGGTVPANTYFISINSDQDNFGFLNTAVNIGGRTYGANGTITLINTLQGTCPNRTYNVGTTIVNYSSPTSLGQGSEGFYVVTSGTNLFAGQDADANDDGMVDSMITYIDGINFIFNPDEQFKYGPGPNLVVSFLGDVPDAATRFPGNTTPNSAAAWYWGELAATPEETTTYAAPFSANFPQGGMLTPGAVNVPAATPTTPTDFDYDGDGKADLSVFRPSDGTWYINGSNSGFSAVKWGATGDTIVPGDYDGDGRTDTAVFRPSDTPGTADFYILNSNGFTFRGVELGSAGIDVAAIADYDGDGKDDVAVFRSFAQVFFIINSSNGSISNASGFTGGLPVPADYDGDRKADPAVYGNGIFRARLSSNGSTVNIPVGQAGDLANPADFDGDGTVDQAVFRPSTGTWFVRQSTTASIVQTRWGANGDVPVAADYDGDSKADFAIYRNGQWWISGSTSGVSITQFGLSSDKPTPSAYVR